MTISTTSNAVVAQGNGLTTSFSFTFPVPLASELFVYYTDATGTITQLNPNTYSVTGIGSAVGGSVTYPLSGSPIATGTSLTIQRVVTYQQLTDIVNQSGFYPNVVENALDYLTMQTQQLAQQLGLALTVPISASPRNLVLPPATARANQLVGFDVSGNAVTYPITASVGAGNLTSEGPFVAGVNFTPGVTTTLTLSKAYGSTSNVSVHFDGTYQGPDQYSLNGTQITFTSPIPIGITKVYIVGGTTLSLYVPPNGSVGDAQLSWGNILNRCVDSIAALRTLSSAVYTRAFVTGYYAAHDGGGGSYQLDPSDTTSTDNGGTVIVAADGGRWKLQYFGSVNAKQFGCKFDGATDDATTLQNAVASGLPITLPGGTSVLKNAITCSTKNQLIQGVGRTATVFNIGTSFTMSAQGVFVVTSGEAGPVFKDFGITFTQPDTNVRANLTAYPPAFFAQGQPRTRFVGLRITAGIIGIDMRQNSGGVDIDQCEFACFAQNIWIDGSLDSVKVTRCHFWNFGLTTNQASIFTGAGAYGIYSGRCDDLHVSDSLFLVGTGITTYTGSIVGLTGNTFGEITNCDFDTTDGLNQTGGWLTVTGSTFTQSTTANYGIQAGAGPTGVTALLVTGCFFSANAVLSSPQVSVFGNLITVTLIGCQFDNINNVPTIAANNSAEIIIDGCVFDLTTNNNFTSPVVNIFSSSSVTFTNNRVSNGAGTGTGNVVTIATDGSHIISNNDLNGWGLGLPANYTQLVLANNTNAPASVVARDVTGSRALGSTYTNNSNKPMFVNISANVSAGGNLVGLVNGGQVAVQGIPSASLGAVSILVPEKATYSATFSGTATLFKWVETY